MICCRKTGTGPHVRHKTVLCLTWVLPIRIIVLASIFASAIYTVSHMGRLSAVQVVFLLIHLAVSLSLLNECRASVLYHKMIIQNEKREKGHRN